MRSLTSYLMTIFAYIFWIFRVAITLMITLKIDIPIKVMNFNYEIIFLFITLIVLVLVTRRKTIGGILYFALYFIYFGNEIYQCIEIHSLDAYYAMFIGGIGILISFVNMVDLLINKNRANTSGKEIKKTDWFYKNKEFDRQKDERADKNNYRLM